MKKYLILSALAFNFLLFSSCDTTDLDLLDDINELPVSALDIDLTMNHLQKALGDLVEDANNDNEGLVRLRHQFFQTWNNAATGDAPGGLAWDLYYTDIYPEANLVIEISENELDPKPDYEAVAKVMRAYGAMMLVDMYGDIPYSEAGQFSNNTDPKLDDAREVYEAAFTDLNEAKTLLNEGGGSLAFEDYYYGGNRGNWVRLINTLLFKYYVNLSSGGENHVASMNALINDGLIETEAQDFQWNYQSSAAPQAESRHPVYISQYAATTVNRYMSNYFMWVLELEKIQKGITTKQDPRTRFYFYRQSLTIPGPGDEPSQVQVLACLSNTIPASYLAVDPDMPFCIGDLENVYWGRDVFNVGGIGPENDLRTTYGLYPIGGRFDDNRGQQVQQSLSGPRNLNGAGISPIMLSSFVYMMRAEAALVYGTSDDATAMLQTGITRSLDKVFTFGDIPVSGSLVNQEDLDNYLADVMAYYATAPDKLEVIAKEALIAYWGNGYEMYNTYRRTGRPVNFQPGLQASGDLFPRSFFYPVNSVTGNNSISQKPDTQTGPFWMSSSITVD